MTTKSIGSIDKREMTIIREISIERGRTTKVDMIFDKQSLNDIQSVGDRNEKSYSKA